MPINYLVNRTVEDGLENGKPGNYPRGSLRSLAQALLFRGADGDVAAIREVADRIDGKVPQAIGGSDELAPTRITVCWASEQSEPTPIPKQPPSALGETTTTDAWSTLDARYHGVLRELLTRSTWTLAEVRVVVSKSKWNTAC